MSPDSPRAADPADLADLADPTDSTDPTVGAIERAAAAALMPLESVRDDGWWLRANDGVTRRGNSVLADAAGADPLAVKIGRAERFYRGRGLPPRFQLSPASQPAPVDAALAERGYVFEEGALVMLGAVDAVAEPPGRPLADELRTRASSAPDGAYLDVLAEVFPGAADQAPTRAAQLRARGSRPLHVTVTVGSAPVAAGLAVVDGPLAGLFSISTRPAARGRGAGAATVRALAAAAAAAGGRWLYLQVGTDNEVAIGLYRRTGFAERYRYHYRVLR